MRPSLMSPGAVDWRTNTGGRGLVVGDGRREEGRGGGYRLRRGRIRRL